MNWKIFNKIPGLKNFDFEDPRTRKNVIMLFLAGCAITAYAVYTGINLFRDEDDVKEEVREQRTSSGSATPTFPEGKDNEENYASRAEALADDRRSVSKVAEIWAQGTRGTDFGTLRSKFDSVEVKKGPDIDMTDSPYGKKNVYIETPERPKPAETKKKETTEEKIARRRDEILRQQGIDPATGLPYAFQADAGNSKKEDNKGKPGAKTSGASASSSTPSASTEETPPVPKPRVVRRSNSVYTLESSGMEGSDITSLETDNTYISESDIHPIRVMFTSTEKIRSGQRVYLRLLEDLVVDGTIIPENSHLPAIINIGERISVSVNSMEMNSKIYMLNLEGYDTDGGKGLYCPQSTANRNIREGIADGTSIAATAITSAIAGGIAGQLTNSGINMARRNLNDMTVTVSSGYTFFLVKQQ